MNYKLGNRLGRGSDGEVYELIKGDKRDKVIKFIRLSTYGIKNYLEHIILYYFDQKYITNSENIYLENNLLLKIIQNRADCDLRIYINNNNLSKKIKKNITLQLVDGLNYLQSRNVIHGDIKPENILKFRNNFKYSDFGMSKICNIKYTDNNLYTFFYRPPEINKNIFDLKSDIWALGCTLYEIYFNKRYFNLSSNKELYHISIENKDIIYILIKQMIEENLDKRLDIKFLCIFFNIKPLEKDKLNINWEKIIKDYNLDQQDVIYFRKKLYNQGKKIEISNKYLNIEKILCNKLKFNFFHLD